MIRGDNKHNWNPFSVAEVAEILSDLSIPWWIAGGFAIELFVGKKIRDHNDIDVAILRKDQPVFQSYLGAWDIHKTNQPGLKPWPAGEYLEPGVNQVWCRPNPSSPWAIEVMFIETKKDKWYFRRCPDVGGSLSDIGLITADGIPYLAPEIQLIYKAQDIKSLKNQQDFEATLPLLSKKQKGWLISALNEQYAKEHAWISRLV